ncbi:MAG: Asp-tRNA(Asn)/Glu-tRNA(Gln) amidotransferase GatCAB subunit A [Paraburkholderia graminis]|uniref:Aspartyl-tRNA(Asn)/glutamyl-tRNA(Gln) amidotransferase subunit A n=1 Tax=Paraburkholderia graminis TaxID=60548 RepID=A0ABD5CPR1_9BURK|nr:Asp-tRNA(Asn)/Glu-tRNA(Gln) amidotransferase GatCAB subunit A [Paraburkholderia graminis]MDQ0622815.1 aspartyl-tRNA(Asn)/glutamyl-tRNA(Gln) amidotransferase subunit A [Paraburkholderia graminis]MDR6207003.1 aspartyl-tRNA(Asn)/glutamyl-tRNA(Gln) amidotransferase subunit A [Paraburkholderia graminis]
MKHDFLDWTLTEAAQALRRRDVTPSQLVEASLERIAAHDPLLKSFITVFEQQALKVAAASGALLDAGHDLGPLHGIPVALKDNIAVAHTRTTAGSRVLADWHPAEDAAIVTKLRQAGAILIGKTNMHEFAWGGTSANPHYGFVRNPWDTSRFPAGSSGGSAVAVAARFCFGAIGTDTGGSIRLPSAVNGTVGIRPTYGRVSNRGIVPLAWSMDTAGPMTRTVEDCATLFGVIAGFDRADAGSAAQPCGDYLQTLADGIRHLRIGVIPSYFFHHLQPAVHGAVQQALDTLRELGAAVVDVPIDGIEDNISAQLTIEAAEPSAWHQRHLRERPQDYGDDVRTLLEVGELLLATHYIQAQRYRAVLRAAFIEAFHKVDVFICPTLPFTATRVGETRVVIEDGVEEDMLSAIMQFTGIASLTGLPALNVPCGFDDEGLPVGMQIIGRPFDEATLFRVGHAFQQATAFHRRAPELIESRAA